MCFDSGASDELVEVNSLLNLILNYAKFPLKMQNSPQMDANVLFVPWRGANKDMNREAQEILVVVSKSLEWAA